MYEPMHSPLRSHLNWSCTQLVIFSQMSSLSSSPSGQSLSASHTHACQMQSPFEHLWTIQCDISKLYLSANSLLSTITIYKQTTILQVT